MASVNTCDFPTIRELRERIIAVIEPEVRSGKNQNEASEGNEFYFIRSISFVLPTPYQAHDLTEFMESLSKVTINSLYYHIYESRLRLEQPTNDFSKWLETLGEKELAGQITRLDPYTHTMEGLRSRLIQLIQKAMNKKS